MALSRNIGRAIWPAFCLAKPQPRFPFDTRTCLGRGKPPLAAHGIGKNRHAYQSDVESAVMLQIKRELKRPSGVLWMAANSVALRKVTEKRSTCRRRPA